MLCESKLWCVALAPDPEADHPPERCPLTAQIPVQAARGSHPSGVDIPFLVPSSCHSICQHYSDLHIAGGQVLPLSPGAGDVEGDHTRAPPPQRPFLLSGDVPCPSVLPPPLRSSRRWREESARDQPSLMPQPLSNSQLNRYLEQKLVELYRQYLAHTPAGSRPLMASELLQTSLDQMTLQLSREQKMETTRAKDVLLGCWLRVTSVCASSEISTPLLQISSQDGAGEAP